MTWLFAVSIVAVLFGGGWWFGRASRIEHCHVLEHSIRLRLAGEIRSYAQAHDAVRLSDIIRIVESFPLCRH